MLFSEYLLESVYNTRHLADKIYTKYEEWLKKNFDLTTLESLKKQYTRKKENQIGIKIIDEAYKINRKLSKFGLLEYDITDDFQRDLKKFVEENKDRPINDKIELLSRKKVLVIFNTFIDVFNEEEKTFRRKGFDKPFTKKEEFNANFFSNELVKKMSEKDPTRFQMNIVERENYLRIYLKIDLYQYISFREHLRNKIRHELVHIFDFSRIKNPISIRSKDGKITAGFIRTVKQNYGKHTKQEDLRNSTYVTDPSENQAWIDPVIEDLKLYWSSRKKFANLKNSQEFLEQFADKYFMNISKSNINTIGSIKKWQRITSAIMSKIQHTNKLIKTQKGLKLIPEKHLIPENFGFLAKLKQKEKK